MATAVTVQKAQSGLININDWMSTCILNSRLRFKCHVLFLNEINLLSYKHQGNVTSIIHTFPWQAGVGQVAIKSSCLDMFQKPVKKVSVFKVMFVCDMVNKMATNELPT